MVNYEAEHRRAALRQVIVARKGQAWGKKFPKYQCNMCNRQETIDRLQHMPEMDGLLLEGDMGYGTCPICRVAILYITLSGVK